ncbi:MAG: hypothetical protein KDD62_04900, partial [Bdellovibrionales bacterium]|nr:hypothetical protein [Bdellovibrionales bacterium]
LPKDPLRLFIDAIAEVQRAMGFENEKDHPGNAPSQFELNYRYTQALLAADQFQLYKLIARQVAQNHGNTASFLPQPLNGVSGSSVHCNVSFMKQGKNLFYDEKADHGIAQMAWDCADRLVYHANETCLLFNSSVNAYRRYSQQNEMPNHIKVSMADRQAIVRIPPAKGESVRIEYRALAPDMNPYLAFYTLLTVSLEGQSEDPSVQEAKRQRTRFLPSNIYDAIRLFKSSDYMTELLSSEVKDSFAKQKSVVADRCPREHGEKVKTSEVTFHHEVTNQWLWSAF